MTKQPMQSVVRDEHGRLRFHGNAIVRYLLDNGSIDLNELALAGIGAGFSQQDWTQFYQLIGYSVTGFHELSSVSDAACKMATEEARKVDPEFKACRDIGCVIHCGVEEVT